MDEEERKGVFGEEHLRQLNEKFLTLVARSNDLLLKYTYFPFKSPRAREYAQHGFSRRLGTLSKSIRNLYKIIPPETVEVPDRERLYDAQINIQSAVANTYGCIDNLAWIWIYENGLEDTIPRNRVGLRKGNKEIRASLPLTIREFVDSIDEWLGYLIEYRDAVAHRIPLYIPPGNVPSRHVDEYKALNQKMTDALNRLDLEGYERSKEELEKLLVFQPIMTHSVTEATKHVYFHAQLLADFATVEELATKLLPELKALSAT